MRLVVVDTEEKFEVQVVDGKKIVTTLDWYGGKSNSHTHPFEHNGKFYAVFGPFHTFRNTEKFVLYELKEVAQA